MSKTGRMSHRRRNRRSNRQHDHYGWAAPKHRFDGDADMADAELAENYFVPRKAFNRPTQRPVADFR